MVARAAGTHIEATIDAGRGHRHEVVAVVAIKRTHLAPAGKDGQVCVWKLEDGGLERSTQLSHGTIGALACGEQGAVVYMSSSAGEILSWRWSEDVSERLGGHEGPISCLAAAPQELLVSGGLDQSIRLWRSLLVGTHRLGGAGRHGRSTAGCDDPDRVCSLHVGSPVASLLLLPDGCLCLGTERGGILRFKLERGGERMNLSPSAMREVH